MKQLTPRHHAVQWQGWLPAQAVGLGGLETHTITLSALATLLSELFTLSRHHKPPGTVSNVNKVDALFKSTMSFPFLMF